MYIYIYIYKYLLRVARARELIGGDNGRRERLEAPQPLAGVLVQPEVGDVDPQVGEALHHSYKLVVVLDEVDVEEEALAVAVASSSSSLVSPETCVLIGRCAYWLAVPLPLLRRSSTYGGRHSHWMLKSSSLPASTASVQVACSPHTLPCCGVPSQRELGTLMMGDVHVDGASTLILRRTSTSMNFGK